MYSSVRQVVIVPAVYVQHWKGDPRKQVTSETMTLFEKMTPQATG